ncbi:GntR family transcriptional regulator [Mycobacterium manitobense]|uniref:GntR family transcriptional regulator n=1 Tax=[Mycobacterium] manitobense TaxID=190147 RepID=A0A9X2YLL8_9MYCO|nr:GntR family transcriptional regulator [[Mycobacterium] manitobense]MCV7169675.1 GntR family transcriptional regulator [[Mycobacterium] manitobense]
MAAPRVDASRHALPPTLVDVAGDRLRDAILSGALRPGEKLVEERLCSEFGISRAPLREALRLLAQQGLVEQMPRRGSRVADCSPSDVRALFALRHVLECHAIDTALPRPDLESALAPVRAALDDMGSAGDELARDDAHRRFHATVTGLAGNRQLDLTLAPILLKLQLPMARNLRTEARHTATDGIARHRAILTALQTNDPAVVIAALADHGHLRYVELPPER